MSNTQCCIRLTFFVASVCQIAFVAYYLLGSSSFVSVNSDLYQYHEQQQQQQQQEQFTETILLRQSNDYRPSRKTSQETTSSTIELLPSLQQNDASAVVNSIISSSNDNNTANQQSSTKTIPMYPFQKMQKSQRKDLEHETAQDPPPQKQEVPPPPPQVQPETPQQQQQQDKKPITTTTTAPTKTATSNNKMFLTHRQLTRENEEFAACWWQTLERFMLLNVSNIRQVEDDAFAAIAADLPFHKGRRQVRMLRDWLDFSIEHLSKWWKMTGRFGELYATLKFTQYINNKQQHVQVDTFMNTTLAVIPYGVDDRTNQEGRDLWSMSLAATILALVQHGVARVVVVGYYHADAECCITAFRNLTKSNITYSTIVSPKLNATTVDHFETVYKNTELAFVHTEDVDSFYVTPNVPHGALKNLHEAFGNQLEPAQAQKYLGKGYFDQSTSKPIYEYVFLTEADQILQARISPLFFTEMQAGRILVPHRLQPLPHPNDLRMLASVPKRDIKFWTPNKTVHVLDTATDACCDTHTYSNRTCDNWWYMCGLFYGNFSYLDNIEFMQLTQGSGIIGMSATEHMRICQPVKNGRDKCPEKYTKDSNIL